MPDYDKYYRLYERRLLLPFIYANTVAASKNKQAFITVPGLGCGQFAGKFRDQLGALLKDVLKDFLKKHGNRFSNIRAVYYNPYSECNNERFEIADISFLVRPLTKFNKYKPQLCEPFNYEKGQYNFFGYFHNHTKTKINDDIVDTVNGLAYKCLHNDRDTIDENEYAVKIAKSILTAFFKNAANAMGC